MGSILHSREWSVYTTLVAIVVPLILQGIGLFGSSWVSDENCTIYPGTAESAGNFSNSSTGYTNNSVCSASSGLKELDVTAYALHAWAFSVLLLPCIIGVYEGICGRGDHKCCEILGVLSYLLYPVPSVLSVVACMTFQKKFPGSSFGLSFKLCLACGLYVLVTTGLSIVNICYNCIFKKPKEYKRDVEVQLDDSTNAKAPSQSDQTTKTHSDKSTSAETPCVGGPTRNVQSVKSIGAEAPCVCSSTRNVQSVTSTSAEAPCVGGLTRNVQSVKSIGAEAPCVCGPTRNVQSVTSTSAEAPCVCGSTRNVQSVKSTSAEAPCVGGPTRNVQSVTSIGAAKSSDSGVTKISLESTDDHL